MRGGDPCAKHDNIMRNDQFVSQETGAITAGAHGDVPQRSQAPE